MAHRDGLSAILIAKNASKTISDTLASLDFCYAIIVLDSGSQDDTVAIARAFGAKVVETDWLGYGIKKSVHSVLLRRPGPFRLTVMRLYLRH